MANYLSQNSIFPYPEIGEEEIPLGEEELQNLNVESHLSIFCKIISEKHFSTSLVQTVMSGVWGIPDNLSIQSGPDGSFQINFVDEFDLFRVLRGAPWRFRNHLFLVKAWEPNYTYNPSDFQYANFWVQLWGLPYSYSTIQVGRKIGQRIGETLDTSIYNISEQPGILVKCLVKIDLFKPLPKGSTIVLPPMQRIKVDYRYEKLPLLCFYCGILGHEDASCRRRYNDEKSNSVTPPPYDVSIRGLPTGRKNLPLSEGHYAGVLQNSRLALPKLPTNTSAHMAEQSSHVYSQHQLNVETVLPIGQDQVANASLGGQSSGKTKLTITDNSPPLDAANPKKTRKLSVISASSSVIPSSDVNTKKKV